MTKIAIAIPSRLGSKRFPRKALYEIYGIPIVLRVCKQAALVLPKSDIYVVTPDEEIGMVARDNGFQAIVNPIPCHSGTEQIVACRHEIHADYIVNVQGDEPFADPESIETIIKHKIDCPLLVSQGISQATLEEAQNPNLFKIAMNTDSNIIFCSRNIIPRNADVYWRICGTYAMSQYELCRYGVLEHRLPLEKLEDSDHLRFIELGIPMIGVPIQDTPMIDEPEDIDAFE